MLYEFLLIWGAAAVGMLMLWAWQVRSRDASLVDVAWAYGVGLAGVVTLALGAGDPLRRLVLALLIGIWSLRLGTHLLRDRILKAHGEDGRYAHWRADAGPRWNRIAAIFFQAQALFVALFAIPAVVLAGDVRPFGNGTDLAALVIWVTGVVIETTADAQLARWRSDPANRGRTCRSGWWRFSRHPNYFGEWLQWCAWPVFALGCNQAGWLWLHPVLVLLFLLLLTGIPHTERRALASRGEDYRRYQRATSPFIPWPPRTEIPT